MRLAGEMLKSTELSEGGNPNLTSNKIVPVENPTLSDLGLSKNESSTYQKLAAIPSDVFENEMVKAKEGDSTKDITVSRFKGLGDRVNLSAIL